VSNHHSELPELFLLLDANVVAPYYVPESSKKRRVPPRITSLMDAVRNGGAPYIFLYIPCFCIAEVFGVFDKYRFGRWNTDVKKTLSGGIPQPVYEDARRRFSEDVSQRRLLHPCDISRYHVLAADLVSPIDHYYQYYRDRARKAPKKPMGTYDHMIIAMGLHLSHVHGRENFAVVTADHRLAAILERARRIRRSAADTLGLPQAAERLGLRYAADIYPRVLNLAVCRNRDLADVLRAWPLPRHRLATGAAAELDRFKPIIRGLYREVGVFSDRLPYTAEFERLYRGFLCQTGVYVTRSQLWGFLLKIRKPQGGGLPTLSRPTARPVGQNRVENGSGPASQLGLSFAQSRAR
jgi:hypothetical protein